jgi:hypothetical protein
MSFQGDVAGIGLGELLQGLARGGRDGVLTLDGEGELSCFLGLEGAQIFFLAGPSEDTDVWRERCSRAWADKPEPHLESKRRAAIAHAARREVLYSMLEAPNLRFRFEPGQLPSGNTSLAREDDLEGGGGGGSDRPWGPGYSVEFLLLEHARIQDESGASMARDLSPGDVPRGQSGSNEDPEGVRLFLAQCDGASTLEEISDRLGWPVRQTRGVIGEYMGAGRIRIADHRELLVASQHELERNRVGRAASRLQRWVELAPAGPEFLEGEAEMLAGEWQTERLLLALNLMTPARARAVMRRLDLIDPEPSTVAARWKAFAECRRRDPIIAFRSTILSAAGQPSPETDAIAPELLALARGLQDKEGPRRARPLPRESSSTPRRS